MTRMTVSHAAPSTWLQEGRDFNSEVLGFVGSQFELVGHSAELGKRMHVHLSHRPAAVNLHRRFGNAHVASNLLAEAASYDLKHDIAYRGPAFSGRSAPFN